MATAKQPGGLYYVDGVAVNANGEVIPNAPPMEPNTVVDPNIAYQSAEQRSAEAIGAAIGKELAKANARTAK